MSKILNLGRARKDRARAERRAQADANAAKHGRRKTEKAADRLRRDAEARLLDGHKRDD